MSACAIRDDWQYLQETTLLTKYASTFVDRVRGLYLFLIEERGADYTPTVEQIADALDSENVFIIESFYDNMTDADRAVGNYMSENAALMESWVEEALQQTGYPYKGCSVEKESEIRQRHSPQNILLIEFLR